MSDLYEQSFYDRISSGSSRSARLVLPLVLERFPAASAIDIGCGSASWLAALRDLGCDDIVGVDGPWAQGENLMIPAESFLECDLSASWPVIERRFDLAMSTEVAEHLPPERSEELVELLCSLADVVVFSAAIPRQGGVNHVNERWPSFWADLFRARGYGALDLVRPRLWTNDDVEFWYRQNLIVYAKGFEDEAPMLDVVHPKMAERGLSAEHSQTYDYIRRVTRPLRHRARRLLR